MNTEFEKYAREQFDGHEVEVDTEMLWTNVYPHVKKEKDNRRVIWFFLFGLLAGIATISLINYNQKNSTDTKDLNEVNQTTINNITEKKHNVEQNNLEQPSTPLSLDATTNQSANPIAKTDHTSTKVKNPNNATNSNTTSTSTAVSTTPPIIATSIDRNIKSEIGIANVTNTKTPTSTKQAPTDTREESSSKIVEIPLVVETPISTNLPLLNILNYIVTSQNNVLTIPGLEQELKLEEESDLDTNGKKLDRPKRSRKNIRLGLGLYGGVSRSTRNFSLNDSIGLNYASERNTSEKRLETLHFGFEVSVHTKNGFYLRSGAEYTRIASVFSTNSSLITTDSMVGIREIIINTVTGQRDSIMGMIPVTTTTEFTKRHYNYIHLIDIPIITGYQWKYAPWSIGVEGGIYANISTKHTGEISSPENDAFYELKKDENQWFKTNIGIQPFMGFHATYHVSNNFQIHFSPGFRFNTVYSTNKNLLKEKHAMLGLRAGIRYIFD